MRLLGRRQEAENFLFKLLELPKKYKEIIGQETMKYWMRTINVGWEGESAIY